MLTPSRSQPLLRLWSGIRFCLCATVLMGFNAPISLAAEPPVNCQNPQTQTEMNICAHREWEVRDRDLNRTYQQLRPNLSPPRRDKLTTAQQRWIAFRDAECEFDSTYAEGGTLQPLIRSNCLAYLTDLRTQELAEYRQGRFPSGSDRPYATVDRELNEVYTELQNTLSDHRRPELITAEQAWIRYRDALCDFERSGGGQAAQNQCLVRMTEVRTNQLRHHLQQMSQSSVIPILQNQAIQQNPLRQAHTASPIRNPSELS